MSTFASAELVPLAASAGVLGYAGVKKLENPAALRPLLAAIHLPTGQRSWIPRALGGTELVIAALTLTFRAPFVAALGVTYAAFTLTLVALLAMGNTNLSCGCFGEEDTPITKWHVIGTLVIALNAGVATMAIAAGSSPYPSSLETVGVAAILAAVTGYLLVNYFTTLPKLHR